MNKLILALILALSFDVSAGTGRLTLPSGGSGGGSSSGEYNLAGASLYGHKVTDPDLRLVRTSPDRWSLEAGATNYIFDVAYFKIGAYLDLDTFKIYGDQSADPNTSISRTAADTWTVEVGGVDYVFDATALTLGGVLDYGTNIVDCTTDGQCKTTNAAGDGYILDFSASGLKIKDDAGAVNVVNLMAHNFVDDTDSIAIGYGPTSGLVSDSAAERCWTDNASYYYAGTRDLCIARSAAGQQAIKDDRGSGVIVGQSDEVTITWAADPGEGAKTSTGFREAQKLIKGVSGRVTTAGTNCATFDVGIVGDTDRYAASIAVSAGTTFDIADATADPSEFLTSAGDVVVTPNANCFDMVLKMNLHHITYSAATSN